MTERLKDAILPGFKRESRKPFSYLIPPIPPIRFRAPFEGGRTRVYTNDEHSPLVIDPHTPEGNLFEFRF